MDMLQAFAQEWGPFALAAIAFWKLDRRLIRLEVVLEHLADAQAKGVNHANHS